MTALLLPGSARRRRRATDRKAPVCARLALAASSYVIKGAQHVTYIGTCASHGPRPGRSRTARRLPWPPPPPRSSPLFP